MKKLDLNLDIEIDEKEVDEKGNKLTVVKVVSFWISSMLERSLNKPDPKTNRPTQVVGMEQQRKYYKVMQAVEANVNGIVQLEDDTFSFLDRKFHQAEMPVQKGSSKVLVLLSDAINKAKI